MPVPKLLYLSQQDVIGTGLTLREATAVVEGALREHGRRQVENPPKPGIHPLPNSFIHAMPAHLRGRGAAGLKWVSGFFGNPARGLPSISGLIILNDVETGLPTAVMDCAYITALRTAAVSGVAARFLARPDAKVLGIVGAGLQGRYHLLALREVLTALETVAVFDVSEPAVQRFIATMGRTAGLKVEAGRSAQAVIERADVVVTATSQLDEPIFQEAWVQPGALVLPVHARGWDRTTPHRMDKFIVDDWEQFHHAVGLPGGFYAPLPPHPYAELSEIVVGAKPGRERPAERIVDFNYGMAMHDVAVAADVLARAKQRNLGTPLPQMDGRFPFSS
jgi:ornithine cyclodeaminase/alanine dehydrogenase-like protein (mu-crystallin family)